MPTDQLMQEPMMAHLIGALDSGEDIGHYGRLVFAMIGRHFISDGELVERLTQNPGFDREQAEGLLRQIDARGYAPPKRERVLEWMRRQEFPICPEPEDRSQCNVYRNLQFPEEVYRKISDYYERGVASSYDDPAA